MARLACICRIDKFDSYAKGQKRWARYFLPDSNQRIYSVHTDVNSVINKNTSDRIKGSFEDQWDMLLDLAEKARESNRLNPRQMEQMILKLCGNRWLSRNQLSVLLGRNPDGLRARYLKGMVQRRLLKLRYPNKPNHIDQAYSACEDF